MPHRNVFLQAREDAKLKEAQMARLVGLAPAIVRALEQGEREPSPSELDSYAQIFGLSIEQFHRGEAKRAPVTVLFRRAGEERPLFIDELTQLESQRTFGEFLRVVRETSAMEELLVKRRPTPLPALTMPRGHQDAPDHGAERLALDLREKLGLDGVAPIESMLSLLRTQLDIRLYFVSPSELNPAIDGASTSSPQRAILVNLIEGGERWWRTRMALGHELCHLLLDFGPKARCRTLFSPGQLRKRIQPFADFDAIERRANAFAACLLAPQEGIMRLMDEQDPTSEQAIGDICRHFGVGRTTAINRLQDTYNLSEGTRLAMERRMPLFTMPPDHPDKIQQQIGLRSGILKDLVHEALQQGRIDGLAARMHLCLPLTEPLPFHDLNPPSLRAPMRSPQDTVRAVAQRTLLDLPRHDNQEIGQIHREFHGWRVEVLVGRQTPQLCGHLSLSFDHQLQEDARTIVPVS